MELGLTEAEFWDLTLAQWFSMVAIRNDAIRREDYRTGITLLVARKMWGDKKSAREARLDDFFGSLSELADPPAPRRPTVEERKATWAAYAQYLKGKRRGR